MYDILSILKIAFITNLTYIILHDLYHRNYLHNLITSARTYIYHKVTAIKDRWRRTKSKDETRKERADAATKRAEAAILNSKNDEEVNDEENALLSSTIATQVVFIDATNTEEIHQQEIHPNTMVAVALPTDPIDTTRDGVRSRTANAIHKYLPQDRLHRLEERGKIGLLKNV